MMKACFASFNTKGFSSSIQNRNTTELPDHNHLTYDGCFNQLKYSIGPKAKKPMQLHIGYARSQNQNSFFDKRVHDFLTIFTKGKKDGEDRDDRILNSVIVLDISGSMGGNLTYNIQQGESRLQLAKQAILMFYSKLRPNDSFGLVLFNCKSQCILPVETVSNRSFEQVSQILKGISAGGGTTLLTGFKTGNETLLDYIKKKQYVKSNAAENRMIMLTDVTDNSLTKSQKFIEQVEESSIHTTIIGISDQFKSSVCQSLNQVKGFNYFCATQIDDLKKYLFENFSFTFFPDTFDIQISVENDNIKQIEVYGTVDSKKVSFYNKDSEGKYIITKSKTSFPSQLQIGQDGQVKTYGGLVLVKLNLKDQNKTKFCGTVNLSYKTGTGQQINEQYPINYESPANQQFFSEESLHQALSGFFYVHEIKSILINARKEQLKERKKYIEHLESLKKIAPQSKLKQLEDLISKMKDHVKQPNAE